MCVVYEYEVEYRITRYLALFSNFPTKVGPIRSARTHSTIMALENNVHFITASASKDVLKVLGKKVLESRLLAFSTKMDKKSN